MPDGTQSKVCPLPMVTQFSWEMIRLYKHYRNNILMHTGGIYDQPNTYIQAMEIIDAQAHDDNDS